MLFRSRSQSTILENNFVQTIGSAGESIAAGVVFTVPALSQNRMFGIGVFAFLSIWLMRVARPSKAKSESNNEFQFRTGIFENLCAPSPPRLYCP